MKYFVKYKVTSDNKPVISAGYADFNVETELSAEQLKSTVKSWLSLPTTMSATSETLTANNKNFVDADMVPIKTRGLEYNLVVNLGSTKLSGAKESYLEKKGLTFNSLNK